VIALSPLTSAHVSTLFTSTDVDGAERLLAHECADNLPLVAESATPESLERIRFAAIRVSGGDLDRLREAIRLAQVDWRDLLVAAEFAVSIDAHVRWQPRRCDAALVHQWMAGDLPQGVEFARSHHVRVLAGRRQGKAGSVLSLVAMEPEPRYLVELDSGERIELVQRMLLSGEPP
jgi:hypothetical protein